MYVSYSIHTQTHNIFDKINLFLNLEEIFYGSFWLTLLLIVKNWNHDHYCWRNIVYVPYLIFLLVLNPDT